MIRSARRGDCASGPDRAGGGAELICVCAESAKLDRSAGVNSNLFSHEK